MISRVETGPLSRRPVIPQFTPDEARAWQALVDLGDGVRIGLHFQEELLKRQIAIAGAKAAVLSGLLSDAS